MQLFHNIGKGHRGLLITHSSQASQWLIQVAHLLVELHVEGFEACHHDNPALALANSASETLVTLGIILSVIEQSCRRMQVSRACLLQLRQPTWHLYLGKQPDLAAFELRAWPTARPESRAVPSSAAA